MNFNQLCDDFLKSNEKIRFVGVINSSGNLIVQKNRKDTTSLLTDDETNMLVHYSFSRWKRLENIRHKLGAIKETITKFEKVSTIMLFFKENLFLISTDPKSNNSKIISELWKIIDGRPVKTTKSKKKPATRRPVKTTKSKKKPATRRPVKTTKSKKKPATRRPVKTTKSKKKPATRRPVKTTKSKKKPATRRPVKTTKSKKKPATRRPVKTTKSKKKPATRRPVKTTKSKKPTSGISKKQTRSDLASKLEQLEKRANLLYQKFQK